MTIQEINRAYERIVDSLDKKEIKSAFVFLHGAITAIQAYSLQEKLDGLQETYTFMLRYRLDGIKDPMEHQIYNSLLISAYELTDQARDKALSAISSQTYYSRRRTFELNPPESYTVLYNKLSAPAATPEQKEIYENALATLFQRIWVSNMLSADESLVIKEILFDPEMPVTTGSQIVSALLMALQKSFDKEKLLLLFDALYLTQEEIRIRALVAILLTLYTYRKRIALYPQIADRLAAVNETYPDFTKRIRTIQLRFILARETEKITRRLQEEIIPEMMKLTPKINQKINLKDFNPEQLGDEMNPEWQDILSEGELGKKMQEFSELQQEGADVMHSTFIHLKNFPFFRELSNWFMPFTPDYSQFDAYAQKGMKERQVLETLAMASFMCNSDKYSLYLSMLQMPEEARTMMLNQFTGQAAEMMEQSKEELMNPNQKVEIIAGQYIQDLYRFIKLYPRRLEFEDIFNESLDFHSLPVLQPYIADEESLTMIAEYYLRKNHFDEALALFQKLAEMDPDNAILYQKIGFCRQMEGELEEALQAYLHADLINPNSKWVIRRIAGCYRTLKRPEEALKYYRRLELLLPDDLSVQMNIGHCLLEQKDYNEALKYYFKVDYLEGDNTRAWRPIAWCSFLTGRFDQARNYYKKILDNQPGVQDYLNAGHTEWALQNSKKAVSYYKMVVVQEEGDFHKFLEQFNQDMPDLQIAGIELFEIPLMLDQVRYAMEDETFG